MPTPTLPKPNFVYEKGSLWFPVNNSASPEKNLKPMMNKGDLASMLPVIRISIPGIYETKYVPFENIVSFEYNIGSVDDKFHGEGTLAFVDTTPIFIETVLRLLFNENENRSQIRIKNSGDQTAEAQDLAIMLQFGWAIQNPPLGDGQASQNLRDLMGEDGYVLCEPLSLSVVGASYKYTNWGVLIDLKVQAQEKQILNSIKMPKTLNIANISSKTDYANALSAAINDAVKQVKTEDTFKVIFMEGTENVNIQEALKIQPDGSLSIMAYMEKVVSSLSIPPVQKPNPFGIVSVYYGERKVRDESDPNAQPFYPIYIWSKENWGARGLIFPDVQFPAHESPITSWQPGVIASEQYVYLRKTTYKKLDADGNQTTQSAEGQKVTAGVASAPNGTDVPATAANSKVDALPKANKIHATIDMSILGDPLLATINAYNSTWLVHNNIIVSDGLVRNPDKFWQSFPSFERRNSDPWDKQTMEDALVDSPFNGYYTVMGIAHKISKGGYTTDIKLFWKEDAILDTAKLSAALSVENK